MRNVRPFMLKYYTGGHSINFLQIYYKSNTPELLHYAHISKLVYEISRKSWDPIWD